jgi:hypothetical protein
MLTLTVRVKRGRIAIVRVRTRGADHDLETERERPVDDVVQIVLDALAHLLVGIGLVAQAENLRPSADAKL